LNIQNANGKTALHLGALYRNRDSIKILIEAGCQLDLQDADGKTALHYLARWPAFDDIEMLIKAGCQLEVQDKDGRTALHDAAESERIESVIKLIEAGANPFIKTKLGTTAKDEALNRTWHPTWDSSSSSRTQILEYLAVAMADPLKTLTLFCCRWLATNNVMLMSHHMR
jgi:ankyrin repeat protein